MKPELLAHILGIIENLQDFESVKDFFLWVEGEYNANRINPTVEQHEAIAEKFLEAKFRLDP